MGDDKMVSAEEARGLLDDQVECFLGYAQIGQDGCLRGPVGGLPDGSWLVALARTVIALHKRLEGVGVVECLAARDAATRERERANKAERERDEARAERDRLRHLRDIVAEQHEDCEQYAAWLANPVRVGRCHVCDLLNTAADAAREVTRG